MSTPTDDPKPREYRCSKCRAVNSGEVPPWRMVLTGWEHACGGLAKRLAPEHLLRAAGEHDAKPLATRVAASRRGANSRRKRQQTKRSRAPEARP